MFHPTVFENLKVAFENELYDLDNLEGTVEITGRRDVLDMAVLSRELSLAFRLAGDGSAVAELLLSASLDDLAAEILEQPGAEPSCRLRLRFHMELEEPDRQCAEVERLLCGIWQPAQKPLQTVSRTYGDGAGDAAAWRNTAEIGFARGIGEEQTDDIPELLRHMLDTLTALRAALGKG